MSRTRPYLVTLNGEQHFVDATSLTAAKREVVNSLFGECRVASAGEVLAYYKRREEEAERLRDLIPIDATKLDLGRSAEEASDS